MKQIFTKKQAVSILHQVKTGTSDVDLMAHVDSKNSLFKLSNDELHERLSKIIDEDSIAGVVDEIN
ncbi:hypothetical protein GW796_00880 [archaeon]|nr:hypothetical protein [archaeon]NCQ50460.1 hypothetical protein [archaeon]